ncbi:MAG TPA: MlaD family protein [Giesbergeria sp.]|jgi:phospholipid/cholesterol/gamma-HCH transport system substrate-binding protein|uniref:MlaD family protein n=1 Tax=Comamonadaceae TaxID=80864 RepID=UPI00138A546B|nr:MULTISPECIES: MlaD family protein [unclassified Acidovorax]MBL8365598.1 MCE family protein [Comamonas sp.]HNE71165.1 MlaD family protein [Giesbergeria sp.]NCU64307.1 MCE family protein [Acidovorax sp. 210-6]HNI76168.1 MlaD family protein [Giesbergeria sp.]HNK05155.1 MlaD family protein [Giesbergeria sp.]
MENKSHAFAAGLFVLVVTALVVGLGVWLTRDRGNYQSYELSSGEGVAGLQPQAAVRYKGVSVGRVTHIGFDSQASGNVLIRIAVSVDAPITPTTFAVLGYQGVTGLAYVLLDDAGEPYPAIAPGPSGLPRLPLRTSPFTQLFDQGPAILSRVQEATERINQVLSDDNQRLLRELLANTGQAAGSVHTLSQRLDATVQQRLDPALAALPPLAREATGALQSMRQAGEQVSGMAAEIGQTAKRINAPGGTLEQTERGAQALAQAVERFGTTTLPRMERAADETARAARLTGRAASSLGENPQGILYGPGRGQPGPGEPGFTAPQRTGVQP